MFHPWLGNQDPIWFTGLPKQNKNTIVVCMPVKSLQSYPTLPNPKDGSPPGSSVHGVPWVPLARILEWVAICFSRGSSRPKDRT